MRSLVGSCQAFFCYHKYMPFDSIIFLSGWILMAISFVRHFIYNVRYLEELNDALFKYRYNDYGDELLKVRSYYIKYLHHFSV